MRNLGAEQFSHLKLLSLDSSSQGNMARIKSKQKTKILCYVNQASQTLQGVVGHCETALAQITA